MDLIRVFVSYSHKDEVFARKLSGALASVGIGCSIDSRIAYGEDFSERINKAIRESSHFVCLVSEASLHSPWVFKELTLADRYGVKVTPILLEPGVRIDPPFDPNIKYIQIYDHDVSEDVLFEHLIEARMFDDGIVPAGIFKRYKQRFPAEFFASELLTQPLILSQEEDKLAVRVNRSSVDYVVISNIGKKQLCKRFVAPNKAELIKLDRRILSFMREPHKQTPLSITTSQLPLRWASGGVLSIVTHDDAMWVPLFFRDIPPYGWNVSLGATERYFNDMGHEIDDQDYSLEYELTSPWKFIVREFLEETLILSNQPRMGGACEWRRFDFPQHVRMRVERSQAERFAEVHLELRRNQDGLDIQPHHRGVRIAICDDTTSDLAIVGNRTQGRLSGAWNVLIAISPLELGIEVIKVVEYKLPSDHCILDGEFYEIRGHRQLVRMPVGLVSLKYLFDNFGDCDYQLQYSDEDIQPSVTAAPFRSDDVRVFKWDFDQRARIWGGDDANQWERERYSEWQKNFEEAFSEGFSGNTAAFPSLFTPATVKAINLFFNCCQRGQAIASNYAPSG